MEIIIENNKSRTLGDTIPGNIILFNGKCYIVSKRGKENILVNLKNGEIETFGVPDIVDRYAYDYKMSEEVKIFQNKQCKLIISSI